MYNGYSERRGIIMPTKYKEADIVSKTTHPDASDMFITRQVSDEHNMYNNNIHYHSFWEMEFVISGSGRYEINNISFPIKRGMLFLTTPADYHTYSLGSGESFELYNVQFRSEHLEDAVSSYLYSCTEPTALLFDGDEFEEMYCIFDKLTRIFSDKRPMYEIVTRNMIENLCVRLIHCIDTNQPNTSSYSIIRNTVIFVKNNYRERITLSDAASYAGLSEAYFSHIFSSVMGVGFSTYVRNVRLDAAANLLKSTEMTVKEICYATGFGNRNYFTEVFGDRFGMSPTEYREKYLPHDNDRVHDGTHV